MTQADLPRHLLNIGVDAAQSARKEIERVVESLDSAFTGVAAGRTEGFIETKSTMTDNVTVADVAAEKAVVNHILGVRPNDSIVGEEGSGFEGTSEVRWLIDPIDGTTNFIYGLPAYAVSIAAIIGDETVAAVVLNPVTDELFTASTSAGAYRNGRTVEATRKADLATALIATGFSYDPEVRHRQALKLQRILPQIRDIRRFGAAALDLCMVATGQVDGYFEIGVNSWDVAAGRLIAQEAGAIVDTLPNGMVVSANEALFEQLKAIVAEPEQTSS